MTTSLSSILPDSRWSINAPATFTQLYVYNTNINSSYNGGQCCLWTVPANVNQAKFEIWGGGGAGGGACCCQMQMCSGGSGDYVRKTVRVIPGCQITICAGGSTCCTTCCCGPAGYNSFVCLNGGTYPISVTSGGGVSGQTNCSNWNQCEGYIAGCGSSGGNSGGDFVMCGGWNTFHTSQPTCGYDGWGWVPGTTYWTTGTAMTRDYCQNYTGGNALGNGQGQISFPGSGGAGGSNSYGNGTCWGAFGLGGMVLVTFR